ncbi:hypothetical protein CNMCM6069_009290 [Aspergillus lentulus]|nr:hypothetical protein CNMCM6069_009290 [Aspergillus lentulus]
MDELGLHFFVYHFSTYAWAGRCSPQNITSAFMRRFDEDTTLRSAVASVGLAALSNIRKDEAILRGARQRYGQAIRIIQSTLRSKTAYQLNGTFKIILMVALFEIVDASPTSKLSWIVHLQGAAALRNRSPRDFFTKNHRAQIMFTFTWIFKYFQTGGPFPLELEGWVAPDIPVEANDDLPAVSLIEILLRFIRLRASLSKGSDQPMSSALTEVLACEMQLEGWSTSLPAKFGYREKVSTDTSQYFYGRFHLYEDVWASRILIHYLAGRLLVNELILHLASQCDTSTERILQTTHARRTIIQMAVDICTAAASQPLFPDYISLDGRDYTSLNRNGAMPPLSGVFMFMYPLAVAATATGVSDDLREWVLRTLDHIGQTMGIRQALLMKAEVAQSCIHSASPKMASVQTASFPNARDLTIKQQFSHLKRKGAFKNLDSLYPLISKLNDLPTRTSIEVGPDDPTTSPRSIQQTGADTLVVGGALVKNASYLTMNEQGSISEVPIRPLPLVTKPTTTGSALLMAPLNSSQPTLFLQHTQTGPLQFVSGVAADPVHLEEVAAEATEAKTPVAANPINDYVLSGDLENFWGVKGLKAKLYVYQGDGATREKVKLGKIPLLEDGVGSTLSKLEDSPLGKLFPHIDLDAIKKLPIKNIEFTYSEEEDDFLYPRGLRLEGDVEVSGGHLQPVADMLARIYGEKHAPAELHVSAHLSDERDWTKPPKITKLVIGAYLDGNLNVWDLLTFKSVGVEISAIQVEQMESQADDEGSNNEMKENESNEENNKKRREVIAVEKREVENKRVEEDVTAANEWENVDKGNDAKKQPKKTWKFGLSVLGTADILGLPKATKPLGTKFRMARDAQEDTLYNIILTADDWSNVYGIRNLNLSKPKFTASFEAGSFSSTIQLNTTAKLSLADITVDIEGKLSKEDSYLDGQVGPFTYHQLLEVYAQIRGDNKPSLSPLDVPGEKLQFEQLHLRLSNDMTEKALELSGKVHFNEHITSNGLIKVGSAGLIITGNVEDFKIEGQDITVTKASLDIEIGARPPKEDPRKGEGDKDEKDGDEKKESGTNTKIADVTTPDTMKLDEKETDIDKNLRNRKSKFAVTGEVEFSGHDIKVGVYYERQAKTKKREWLLYGEIDRVQLSEFFRDLSRSEFDYVLENVALIAASQDYGDTDDINLKGYEVRQGLSLWATIKPPKQITDLSNDPPPFSSVKLEVNYYQRVFTIQVEMPPEFAIDIPKTQSRLERMSVGLETGLDPKLTLRAILKIVLKGQKDPLEIEVMIKAGAVDANGSLQSITPWVNPFDINKDLILNALAVELGINYATVAEQGPSTFGLTAEIDIDSTMAKGGMLISETEGEMFQVAVENMDMCKIVRFAGRLAKIESLKNQAGVPGILVIEKGKLYLSSGVRIGRKTYSSGISVAGKMKIFDRTGEFSADINDAGFTAAGTVDSFQIGALKVSAADDEKNPASFDIAMTPDEQRVKVDGMVRYKDVKMVARVDCNMQAAPAGLDAHLLVQFDEGLEIDLLAHATVSAALKLSETDFEFSAVLDGHLFDLICKGITTALQALQKYADKRFTDYEQQLSGELAESHKELKEKKEELYEAESTARKNEAKRKQELENAKINFDREKKKLDDLKEALANAKSHKDGLEKLYREELDNQKRERDTARKEAREQYNKKMTELQDEERRLKADKAGYDNQRAQSYGALEAALNSWLGSKKEAEDRMRKAKESLDYWNGRWNRAGPFERMKIGLSVDAAKIEDSLAEAHWAAVIAEQSVVSEFKNRPEYRFLMDKIDTVTNSLVNVVKDLTALKNQGIDGFIRAAITPEEEKVQEAQKRLDALLDVNSKEQKAIRRALKDLENDRPDIELRIQQHNNEISRLEDEGTKRVAWLDYDNAMKQYNNLKSTVGTLKHALETIHHEFDAGIQVVKDKTVIWRRFFPDITRIEVKASTNAIKAQKPIMMSVTAEYEGKLRSFSVEWTPSSKFRPYDLYKTIATNAKKNFT